jgi:hypothetical protein
VPQRSKKYAELATWVRNQRAAKRYNRPIIAGRGKRLDEIGFIWKLSDTIPWEEMYARLVEYKTHGDCNVPQKSRNHRRLGKWVNSQRTQYKRGNLKPERVRLLQEIGFVWHSKRSLSPPGQMELPTVAPASMSTMSQPTN